MPINLRCRVSCVVSRAGKKKFSLVCDHGLSACSANFSREPLGLFERKAIFSICGGRGIHLNRGK
jgi:hypothetical protein